MRRNFLNELEFIEDKFDVLLNAGRDVFSAPAYRTLVTDDGLNINLELPGLGKEDLELGYENNSLVVKVNKTFEGSLKRYNKMELTIPISARYLANIDPSKITAKMINGELNVLLPKKEGVSQKIEIN